MNVIVCFTTTMHTNCYSTTNAITTNTEKINIKVNSPIITLRIYDISTLYGFCHTRTLQKNNYITYYGPDTWCAWGVGRYIYYYENK